MTKGERKKGIDARGENNKDRRRKVEAKRRKEKQ